MTPERFDRIVNDRLAKIKTVLTSKSKEYASDSDRLYNFKAGARIDGETSEECLWGYFKKHLVSVMDLVDGKRELTDSAIDEKIGDCINYLILLEAVFLERIEGEEI